MKPFPSNVLKGRRLAVANVVVTQSLNCGYYSKPQHVRYYTLPALQKGLFRKTAFQLPPRGWVGRGCDHNQLAEAPRFDCGLASSAVSLLC